MNASTALVHSHVAAALGMAAGFDQQRGLWIPDRGSIATYGDSAEYRRLEALACKFAVLMGEQLKHHRGRVLSEVQIATAGHIGAGLVSIDGVGTGTFEKATARPFVAMTQSAIQQMGLDPDAMALTSATDLERIAGRPLDHLAAQLARKVHGYEMFVPISTNLRAGEAFDPTNVVVTATDNRTGISVRVLRTTDIEGEVVTGFEMAAGFWGQRRSMRLSAGREVVLWQDEDALIIRPRVDLISPEEDREFVNATGGDEDES